MDPNAIRYKLAMAADRLATHNGPEWANFCQALGLHAELSMTRVLKADPGAILNAQGQAIALNDLCTMLFNAKQVAQEAERMMRPPTPKPAP